jgi:uncharacterized protein (TIGR03437 family)
MRRLLHNGAIAAMALALPLAALAQNNLNLDAGSTGTSGGDIVFNPGVSIAPVSSAGLFSVGASGNAEFSALSEFLLAAFSAEYSSTPIGGSSLVVNEVFAVHTNGGNYAKALVTAASSTSITLQYITYNTSGAQIQGGSATLGAAASTVPSIGAVLNNYSSTLPNAPNYGIAPGTLIVIYGSNLAAAGGPTSLQDPSKALPQTLSGSSVAVTINGTTVHPGFYYAFPGQIAVVLPSNTPVGTGTIAVTNGTQTSATFPLKVVASAFGFDYYGGVLAAVTDNADGHLITTSRSAKPGEVIVFWGSGLGADTKNTDLGPPTSYDNLSYITSLYFGSVQVPIAYQGRSPYQGVDQVVVTVPTNAPLGCATSVVGVAGNMVSNFVALPIATNGGTCVDSLSIVNPSQTGTLSGKTTVKFGAVAISQDTTSDGTLNAAIAIFDSISGSSVGGYTSSKQPSYGSCFVTQSNSSTVTSQYTVTGLDAGSISVQGPVGSEPLPGNSFVPGIYLAQLPAGFIPASGGTFTFTGTGGADVGAFTGSVVFNTPLVWTNSTSDGTVTRASGVTVDWNGGNPGTYVQISGSASNAGFSASFVCNAPVAAQTFTVPPPVLLALPAGSGSLAVSNYTIPAVLTIPNLDFAYAEGYAMTDIDATYN